MKSMAVQIDRSAGMVQVEVIYALPETAHSVTLKVAAGTTVAETIRQSGLLQRCPGIDLKHNRVGIFGKLCDPEDLVGDGDRVEIYRSLRIDPKEARRRAAAAKRRT
jgi:uncharacterized protein